MKPIIKRTYRSAQMLKNIIVKKGYTETEAWGMVQRMFDTIPEGEDMRRYADRIITKAEWEAMYA